MKKPTDNPKQKRWSHIDSMPVQHNPPAAPHTMAVPVEGDKKASAQQARQEIEQYLEKVRRLTEKR